MTDRDYAIKSMKEITFQMASHAQDYLEVTIERHYTDALHGLILACAGFMVLMLILVTQDWQMIGVILAIVAGSSLVIFFGTGLTTLMRSIEFGLAEFVGS
ncbi:Uncharacterised protein [uncultured Clostridium sp.]|uniref:Uncharacterized protein n=1 Tax=Muricoprocola aceti TaxID=2981772 RepID=A0ABT2SMT6_9FIRM|nr:hypothetical protein [Muricoprocola aceti]MCU6725827.1 hypothetical protein [Muricoprocola aceti]SCH66297.1 Uncharacterised protein [uncultured Clostridium sp.]